MRVNAAELKNRRELAGLLIVDLAREASVSTAYVSMLERGERREMSPPVALRLAKALGCAIVDLREDHPEDAA